VDQGCGELREEGAGEADLKILDMGSGASAFSNNQFRGKSFWCWSAIVRRFSLPPPVTTQAAWRAAPSAAPSIASILTTLVPNVSAKIVAEDDDNVWFCWLDCKERGQRRQQQGGESKEWDLVHVLIGGDGKRTGRIRFNDKEANIWVNGADSEFLGK